MKIETNPIEIKGENKEIKTKVGIFRIRLRVKREVNLARLR